MFETYSDNLVMVEHGIIIVMAIFTIVFFVIAVRSIGTDKSYNIKFRYIVIPLVLSIAVLLFIDSAVHNNAAKYYSSKINELYGAEIVNDDYIYVATQKLDSGKPSGKIIVKFGEDNRYYETYLIKDSETGNLSLYTKNEKGVYLPVTNAAAKYAGNGSYVHIEQNNEGSEDQLEATGEVTDQEESQDEND